MQLTAKRKNTSNLVLKSYFSHNPFEIDVNLKFIPVTLFHLSSVQQTF